MLVTEEKGTIAPCGAKTLYNTDKELNGNEWCKTPAQHLPTFDAPQFTNAIHWDEKGSGSLTKDALGYYVMQGNNVDNNPSGVILFSCSSRKGHGVSVLPENFLRITAMFCARKTIIKDWTNAKDEYCVPDTGHPDYAAFEADSILVALFHSSAQQSSLGNVDYKGKIWDIKNEWFWLTKAEAEAAADNAGCAVAWQAARTANERYVAANLPEWETRMSAEGHAVLALARKIASKSYAFRQKWDALRPELQLLRWDAGWHQLKPMVQAELPTEHAAFQKAFAALKSRLRPLVHTLGFLR